jgi:hypothetical protein
VFVYGDDDNNKTNQKSVSELAKEKSALEEELAANTETHVREKGKLQLQIAEHDRVSQEQIRHLEEEISTANAAQTNAETKIRELIAIAMGFGKERVEKYLVSADYNLQLAIEYLINHFSNDNNSDNNSNSNSNNNISSNDHNQNHNNNSQYSFQASLKFSEAILFLFVFSLVCFLLSSFSVLVFSILLNTKQTHAKSVPKLCHFGHCTIRIHSFSLVLFFMNQYKLFIKMKLTFTQIKQQKNKTEPKIIVTVQLL